MPEPDRVVLKAHEGRVEVVKAGPHYMMRGDAKIDRVEGWLRGEWYYKVKLDSGETVEFNHWGIRPLGLLDVLAEGA